jgi:hypothetical protein
MKIRHIVSLSFGVTLLVIMLVAVSLLAHRHHNTQRVRADLVQQLGAFAQEFANANSNVVTRLTHGAWLGRVHFLDGEWVAIAHHSRHTDHSNPLRVDDITVLLTSDGLLHNTEMHYCRDWTFENSLRYGWNQLEEEVVYSNRTDFLSNHFMRQLDLTNDRR